MTTPTVELVDLEVLEGSPVDKGDNPPAVISFWKGAGLMDRMKAVWARMTKGSAEKMYDGPHTEMEQPRTVGQILAMKEFAEAFYALKGAFAQSVSSIMEMAPAEQMGSMLTQTVAEFNERASALAASIEGTQKSADLTGLLKSLEGAVGDQEAFAQAVEKLEGFEPMEKAMAEQKPVTPETPAVTPASEVTAPTAEVIKAQQELAEVTKRLADAEKVAADAKSQVAKMEDERVAKEFLEKADKLDVPGLTKDEVAKSLKTTHLASAEAGATLERAYAAMAAQVKKNDQITKSIGSAGNPADNQLTAHGQLVMKADELRKQDPKLTKEQAFVRAGQMYPALKEQAIHNPDTAAV